MGSFVLSLARGPLISQSALSSSLKMSEGKCNFLCQGPDKGAKKLCSTFVKKSEKHYRWIFVSVLLLVTVIHDEVMNLFCWPACRLDRCPRKKIVRSEK